MDDLGLANIENSLKWVEFEKRVSVVRGEALFTSGTFGKIPRVSGGGRGHSAKKTSEGTRGAKAGLFEIDEILNKSEIFIGDLRRRRGREGFGWHITPAMRAVAAAFHFFAKVMKQ